MGDEKNAQNEFKVVDRRRFNEEGEEKPTKSPETTRESLLSNKDTKKDGSTKVSQEKVDFSGFVVSLATQALVMMGEVPNPETGLVAANMEAAKQTIEIIALLEEKTKNNLTAEEARLLEEVLHGVRLAYVNKISGKK